MAQGKPRPVVCHVHSPSVAHVEHVDKLLVLGAAHSTNWEVQRRGKNAHFKGGITCGRKQMSFQCTVKHALVQSQQVLNVVFSAVPSSSPRIHPVSPPSCCTQSRPCLPCSSCQSHSICMYNFWYLLEQMKAIWTWPPLSLQCAEQTHRAVREFLSLEMKTCTLLQLWFLISTGQEEEESWWDPSFLLLFHHEFKGFPFKCPFAFQMSHFTHLLPCIKSSAFPGSVDFSAQKELRNFSHQAKLAEVFFFFSLFCLEGMHS